MLKWIIAVYLVATVGTVNHENWLGWKIDNVPKETRTGLYVNQGQDWRKLLNLKERRKFKKLKQLARYIDKNYDYFDEQYDVWENSEQTIKRSVGDCEDFAILFCDYARQNGFDVRVALGYHKTHNKWMGHAFNIWIDSKNKKIWIIDVKGNVFIDSRYVTNYIIDHSFDNENIYQHI